MHRLSLRAAAALLLAFATPASATTYSLYVHGRTGGVTGCGVSQPTPTGWSYWNGQVQPGVNPIPVNYDGTAHLSVANPTVRGYLDQYCTGGNACYVACHSAGCAHVGYALDLYGGRWNILWIDAAGSAEGGTELSDYFGWAACDALGSDLRTGTVRSLYNHNDLRGATSHMFAGAKSAAYFFVLPGDDDAVVPFHSAGGMSSTGRWCKSGTWLCTTLPSGTTGKYAYHTLWYRDDAGAYDHYVASGIPRVMASDMSAYAR
jgi:hypothetical protein